ncbi:DEAD/DEAH box helicase, partial [Kibdelosporangium lantanae]
GFHFNVTRESNLPSARLGALVTTVLESHHAGDGLIWVGSPLRVHRRCDRPMFDVSNQIAYGGDLMVYGTHHKGEYPGENLWLDVRSAQSDGNWVPAEGTALIGLINELVAEGIPAHDIRVVSPFRDVVYGAKNLARRHDPDFADKNIGTVHTVQGQEANVVILVLGSAPKKQRAREWAAEKPNLLNVAVSRAKRRFYVIGNRPNWKDLTYFSVLAGAFTVRQIP